MHKFSIATLLMAAVILSFSPVQSSFAKDIKSAELILGKWSITHRPVDKSGQPCAYLPESIEFFKDGTVVMSNMPDMHMPFKIDLTADEKQAIEKRAGFNGKKIMLIKPNPQMDWKSTPMVYNYSVNKKELSLTIQDWEKATFKREK
jgi:hypothetical protein